MKQTVIVAILMCIVGLVVGIDIGKRSGPAPSPIPTSNENQSMDHQMDSMTYNLEGKTGDVFDQAFLDDMIVHHQGAIDMAEQALLISNRQEIIELSKAIIEAQTKEIEQMNQWRVSWF